MRWLIWYNWPFSVNCVQEGCTRPNHLLTAACLERQTLQGPLHAQPVLGLISINSRFILKKHGYRIRAVALWLHFTIQAEILEYTHSYPPASTIFRTDCNDKCARASCVHSRMLSSASVLRFMAAAPRDVAVAPSIQRLRIGLHAVFSPIFPIEMLLSSPTESEMSCSLSPLSSFRVLNACGPQPASQKNI